MEQLAATLEGYRRGRPKPASLLSPNRPGSLQRQHQFTACSLKRNRAQHTDLQNASQEV